MNYRILGRTGFRVSVFCMGTMQFGWSADEPTSQQVLSSAYEAGINFIDSADIYSQWVPGNPGGVAEEIVGRWMKQTGIPRDKLILATKVRGKMGDGPDDEGLSRVHIMKAAEASLRRLQTDYIDLYQTHWPDDNVPHEETLRALDDLVRQGKVRFIGCSNYAKQTLFDSLAASKRCHLVRFDTLQPHYNLIHRDEFERDLRELCITRELAVIPYSPLAGGFLTGKYRPGQPLPQSARADHLKHALTEKNFALIDCMDSMARQHAASVGQVALAWLLAEPTVTSLIIGPNRVEQLQDNLATLQFELSAEEKSVLDETTRWH